VVNAGRQAMLEPQQHFEIHGASYAAKRRELIESGVLQIQDGLYVFAQDQFFSSASASVVAGQNQNADHWVTADGSNLGDRLRKVRSAPHSVMARRPAAQRERGPAVVGDAYEERVREKFGVGNGSLQASFAISLIATYARSARASRRYDI